MSLPVPKGMEHLTIKECEQRLRCSRWTIYRRIADGELEAFKSGSRVLVTEASLASYIKNHVVTGANS